MQTNGGVFVYNVNGICPGAAGVSYPGNTNYQKSFALGNTCGTPDYFYDFFVNVADLAVFGIATSTPLRFASTTVMNPNPALCNQAVADIAGVDNNSCTITASCWVSLIDNYFPVTIDNLNGGTPLDRSSCPAITSQVKVGNTSVSGTTSEANGNIIKLYYNGVLVQTTISSGGTWTFNPLTSPLIAGNTVTVSATAPGKSESFTNCSSNVVADNCTALLINATECAPKKGFTGIAGSAIPGAVIRVYDSSLVLQTPDAGSVFNAGTITANTDGSWLWKCNGSSNACAGANNCLSNGTYYLTQQTGTRCESAPVFICVGTSVASSVPAITQPLIENSTTLSGTGVTGSIVYVYVTVNGIESYAGSALVTAGTWTLSVSSLVGCSTVRALAIEPAKCPSASTSNVTVFYASPTIAPVITGTYCAAAPITTVEGVSFEGAGSTIRLFVSGVQVATTTSLADGSWTVTGLSLTAGQVLTARATAACKSESALSASVTVRPSGVDAAFSVTTTGININTTTITGTGTNGNTVTLFIDDVQFATATVAGGNWNATGWNNIPYIQVEY